MRLIPIILISDDYLNPNIICIIHIISTKNMGNIDCLPQFCRPQDSLELYKTLKNKYRHEYATSIFYGTCIRALKQYKEYNLEIRQEQQFTESEHLKRSLLQSQYSQTEHLNQDSNQLPTRYSAMSEIDKKQKIIQLIRDSYIFLDLSDVFEGDDLEYYEKQVKKQIFKNEQSFVGESFLIQNNGFETHLCDSLKSFNTEAILQLDSYIQLCNIIKKDAQYTHSNQEKIEQFTSYLLRQLISRFIVITKSRQLNQSIETILQSLKNLINIMEDTVAILYRLKIKDNMSLNQTLSNMAEDSYGQIDPKMSMGSNSSKAENVRLQFLNRGNYYTLISSIVLSNEALSNHLVEIFTQKFAKQFKNFKQTANYQNLDLIKMLKHQKTGIYKIKSNVEGLFSSSKQDSYNLPFSLFTKSIKIFNKITSKPEPILKLKMIAEMERQLFKEFTQFQSHLQLDLMYDREVSKIISKWLLHRDKAKNVQKIISIIITYVFIHKQYRMGKKGSSIVCMVEQIENILKWKLPFE